MDFCFLSQKEHAFMVSFQTCKNMNSINTLKVIKNIESNELLFLKFRND